MSSPRAATTALLSLLTATTATAAFLPLPFHFNQRLAQHEARQAAAGCSDVHFFLARGNNEPYPGRQHLLVEATCNGLAGTCDYEDLIYSALYTDEYCQTAYDGAIAGHVQMAAYATRCPDAKLILAGYSQGGQIATDILGGGGATLFNGCVQPPTPPLDRSNKPGSMVAAAIVFGDTRHTANQPYNYGNGSAINGLYPRSGDQLAALDAYAPILRNWCSNTDPICSANQEVFYINSHLGYYDAFSQEAAAWLRSTAKLTVASSGGGVETNIPQSISGIVQNYATIPSGTPSGDVRINTEWTAHTAVGAPPATTTSAAVTTTPASSSAVSPSASASGVVSSSAGVSSTGKSAPATTTPAPTKPATGAVVTTSSSAPASTSSGAAERMLGSGRVLEAALAAGAVAVFYGM